MSELEIRAFFEKLGQKNDKLTCFAGGGVYDHYAPSVIQNLLSRSEFLTSYTPYQASLCQYGQASVVYPHLCEVKTYESFV